MSKQISLIHAVKVAFRIKLDHLWASVVGGEVDDRLPNAIIDIKNSINLETKIKDGYGGKVFRGHFRSICKEMLATEKETEELVKHFFEPI